MWAGKLCFLTVIQEPEEDSDLNNSSNRTDYGGDVSQPNRKVLQVLLKIHKQSRFLKPMQRS